MKNKGAAIDKLLESETAKYERNKRALTELKAKIKENESAIDKIKLMQSSEKLNALISALSQKGLSIDDVMAIISEKGASGLSEKIAQDAGCST